jgi:hypothetical protein
MAQKVDCPCGGLFAARRRGLVSNVEQHVQSDHPDLVGTMSRADLGMA